MNRTVAPSRSSSHDDTAGSDAPRTDVPSRPFKPGQLRRMFLLDRIVWWGLIGVLLVFIAAADLLLPADTMAGHVGFVVLLGLWMWINLSGARVVGQLPAITAAVEMDPRRAEAMIHGALRRWPLQRAIRVTLYHRLAAVWHHRGRFADASLVCQALLGQPLGRAKVLRGPLLLLLAECRLQCHDVYGAHAALAELSGIPLNAMELMQKVALQIRYEVTVHHDAAALADLAGKLALIELMPGPQCGALHAMLAVAARRSQRDELAGWLGRRAQLLCSPAHLAAMGVAPAA